MLFRPSPERSAAPPGGHSEPELWHALPIDAVLARLEASREGLSASEARRRLAEHGRNALAPPKRRSLLARLLSQFNSLLIYVLLASAAVSFLLGHPVDAAVILLVVVINALVGLIQEGRAERALEAIRGMLAPQATVVRGRQRLGIPAEEVVPGDLVLVEPGDSVPADLRLVRVRSLRIEEAVLTGESVPVEKAPLPVAADAALGDRSSMAFSGTLVAAGQGEGVVVGTGSATELGRISSMLAGVETLKTPLLRQMDEFARRLTVALLAACAAVFAFGVFGRGYTLVDMFMAAIAIAVAAIPEGLPAVLTITLAIGVQRMAARRAIVRQLPAVETLGAVTVICSDKTGTLTRNEMTVRHVAISGSVLEVSGIGYEPRGGFQAGESAVEPASHPPLLSLARAALLCNDSALRQADSGWTVEGDPMEGALISLGTKAGLHPGSLTRELPRIDEIPFDANHRFMATLHGDGEIGALLYVKGAPERVLSMCTRQAGSSGEEVLDRGLWDGYTETLASQGERVLALAMKRLPERAEQLTFADADELVLLGLVGLIDPPREEAVSAVRDCRTAGVRVKMITGDHAATARAIARQLGLENVAAALTGRDIDALDEKALRLAAQEMDVFARASPQHKLRLVTALQAKRSVVAMTGDGVNDAPALKRADVGIAMGRKGTAAAKQAAKMVLADDNFASIAAAVREGRTVYDNLRKAIAWSLPTNAGEAMAIAAAILLGLTLPVTPVQILWINTVTAVTLGLTLAFEPPEPDVMRRPPRRADEPLLSGLLVWRVVLVSVLFAVGAFGMFALADRRGLSLEESRTIVVNTIVVLEIFYLFSVRYQRVTSVTWQGVVGTRAVLIGVGTVVGLQFIFTYTPFMNSIFGTRPVALLDGVLIVGTGIALLAVLEIEKFLRRRIGLEGA